MRHNNSLRRYLFAVLTILFSIPLFSQVTIKERVTINPRSPIVSKQSGGSFDRTGKVTVPFDGSVEIISNFYSEGACRRFLALDGTIVISDLQYAIGGGLGDYPAGAELSFTLLVENCVSGDTTKIPYPVQAVQTISSSPCGALYELGDIAYDENGDEIFNSFLILVSVSPKVAVPPLTLQCDVGTGVVYFGDPSFFVVRLIDQCGSVVAAPGISVRVEIIEGMQWGLLAHPVSGRPVSIIDTIVMDQGEALVYYNAWGEEPQQQERVGLRVTSSDGQFDQTAYLYVRPQVDRLLVTPGRRRLQSGDTTRLDIQMLNYDGTPSTGEMLLAKYTILENDTLALLYSPDSTQIGKEITGVFPIGDTFCPRPL